MVNERIPIWFVIEVLSGCPRLRRLYFGEDAKSVAHSAVRGPTKRQIGNKRFKWTKGTKAALCLGLQAAAHDNSPFGNRPFPCLHGGRRSLATALAEAVRRPPAGMITLFGVNAQARSNLADLIDGVNLDGRDDSGTEVWLKLGQDGRPLAECTIVIYDSNGVERIETDPVRLMQLAHRLGGTRAKYESSAMAPGPELSLSALSSALSKLVPPDADLSAIPLDQITDPEVRASLLCADPGHAARYFEAKAGLFAKAGSHRRAALANGLAAQLHSSAGNLEARLACEVRRIPNLKAIDDGTGLCGAIAATHRALTALPRRSRALPAAWGRFLLEIGATLWIYGDFLAKSVLERAQSLLPDWEEATPTCDADREAIISACRVQRFLAEIDGMASPGRAVASLERVAMRLVDVGGQGDVASCVASQMGIENFHDRPSRMIDMYQVAKARDWFHIGSRWNEVTGLALMGSAYRRLGDSRSNDICQRALEGYHEFRIIPSLAPVLTKHDAVQPGAALRSRGGAPIQGTALRAPKFIGRDDVLRVMNEAPS